jgi:hypothetical protein
MREIITITSKMEQICLFGSLGKNDLFGNENRARAIEQVLEAEMIRPYFEKLDRFKQIIVHCSSYTGVFSLECGIDKVIEFNITMNNEDRGVRTLLS